MGTYKIVKVQLPIVGVSQGHGIAGHNFVVMLDDQNRVVSELQGLATKEQCDENGNPIEKPIGLLLSDRLKVHEKDGPYFYQPHYPQQVVFEGSKEEVEAKWRLGQMALVDINRQDLHYPPLGVLDIKESPLNGPENSNSVASTILKAMELPDPDLGWRLTPGEGKQLIGDEELQRFKNNPAPTSDEIKQNQCVPQQQKHDQFSHATIDMISPEARKLFESCREQMIAYCEKKNITSDNPEHDFNNAAMALTAEARSGKDKMRKVEQFGIDVEKEMAVILNYQPHLVMAKMPIHQATETPMHESINKIVQNEQLDLQMEQNKQTNMAMEHSRGGRFL